MRTRTVKFENANSSPQNKLAKMQKLVYTQTFMFIPMAISLAFGVLFATAITLFLVPCLYMALEDLLVATGRRSKEPAADTLLTGTDPS